MSKFFEVVIVEEAARLNVPLYNDSSDIVELESFKVQAKVLQESTWSLLSAAEGADCDAMGSETSDVGLGDAADA